MNVTVKLFSVFREYYPNYDNEQGIRVALPAGGTVAEILSHLGLPAEKKPIVSCNGHILDLSDKLEDGCLIQVFQPVAGG